MQKLLEFSIPALPPSVNQIYKISNRRMYKVDSVVQFEEIASEYLPHYEKPINKGCKLILTFQFKDQKKYKVSDVSNLAKVAEDTLVLCGLLENDNLIVEINYKKELGVEDGVRGYFIV